jgi:palmitoyl-protein thioesterase
MKRTFLSLEIIAFIFTMNFIDCSPSDTNLRYNELEYKNLESSNLNQNIINIPSTNNHPIAVFHGIGDSCEGWMNTWTNYIGNNTNSYARCIESGANQLSIFSSIQQQSETACKIINEDENFKNDFSIVGFSQGGLIGRYILEKCQMKGTVRKFLTVGTPHMGIESIPCPEKLNFLCNSGTFLAQYLVYTPFVDRLYAPLAYVRTPSTENLYRKYNKFLANLNNESFTVTDCEVFKRKFENLEKLVLIKFKNDDVVIPKESAWFQKYDREYHLEDLKDSVFYKEDFLGLRYLDQNGRVKFYEFEGKHMKLTKEEIDLYVVNEILS